MKWSNEDLGNVHGVCRQTFAAYVSELMQQRKFKKSNPGKCYSEKDVEDLSKLLGFDYQRAVEFVRNKK